VPQAEPVSCRFCHSKKGCWAWQCYTCGEIDDVQQPAAQPEQEPVAYYHPHKGFYWAKPTHISAPTVVDVPPVPLYVKWKAAQRPWVGLTDAEKKTLATAAGCTEDDDGHIVTEIFRLAETKLKEKNDH
jgi:hypothetical protein